MSEEVRAERPPTRVNEVMELIRQRIESRALMPASRLPSIREMAERVGVSKTTVVDAYDRLVAQGVIGARRGAGFFVAGHAPPLALASLGPQLDREVDPLWITRQSLETSTVAHKPGCGWMPPSWMPEEALRRALRAMARGDGATLSAYQEPLGLPVLRQQIGMRLARLGISADPRQIMLTDSGSHSLDLLCRFLLEPGDTVLLDDPCYFNFQAMLRAHRVNVVSVRYTPEGPDLAQFEAMLMAHSPRLYLTNSAVHNPTGATLSATVAHRLLKLAERHDLLIVEDDIFADFEHTPAPRLAAFDGLQKVITIGSFSKTLSAAARCGYIAARGDWIESLVDLKLATTFGNGGLASTLVSSLLLDGTYRRHLESVHARLADAMGQTITRLEAAGLTLWHRPEAGMFVWARLPDGLNAAVLARLALADDVILAPGNVFSVSQAADGYLRFNVSQCSSPAIFKALRRSMEQAKKAGQARQPELMPLESMPLESMRLVSMHDEAVR